mmetsp:Transcript_33665/g.72607  ORF Transcript_33665/g.72607 Transcript_33665/m.72607 type:complete len:352 (+) Transcript_33665:206-1261(+)
MKKVQQKHQHLIAPELVSNTHPTATSEGIEIGRFKGAIQKLPILQVSFDGKLLKVLSLAVPTCRGKIDRPTLWNQIAINLGVFAQAANHHLHGRRCPPDFLKERPGLVHGLQQWAIQRERLAVPEILDLLSEPLLQRWKRFQPVETALNAAQGGIMGCEHHPDAEVQQFFLVCAFSLQHRIQHGADSEHSNWIFQFSTLLLDQLFESFHQLTSSLHALPKGKARQIKGQDAAETFEGFVVELHKAIAPDLFAAQNHRLTTLEGVVLYLEMQVRAGLSHPILQVLGRQFLQLGQIGVQLFICKGSAIQCPNLLVKWIIHHGKCLPPYQFLKMSWPSQIFLGVDQFGIFLCHG